MKLELTRKELEFVYDLLEHHVLTEYGVTNLQSNLCTRVYAHLQVSANRPRQDDEEVDKVVVRGED